MQPVSEDRKLVYKDVEGHIFTPVRYEDLGKFSKEERAAVYAGQIRTELGEKLGLIEKNAYRFCYVNDFPMFEKDPDTKQIGFTQDPICFFYALVIFLLFLQTKKLINKAITDTIIISIDVIFSLLT